MQEPHRVLHFVCHRIPPVFWTVSESPYRGFAGAKVGIFSPGAAFSGGCYDQPQPSVLVSDGYMPVGCTEFAKCGRRELYKLGDVGMV